MKRLIIIGRSRSGTTITQSILNAHPDIQVFNEKHIYSRPNNLDAVLNKEKRFYGGKTVYFGDKQGMMSLVQHEMLLPLNIKYVYIYRDGRDVVSSGIRLGKRARKPTGWKSPNQRLNSKSWADSRAHWNKVKEILPEGSWCEIRFEDYLDNPGKNSSIVANFLDVDVKRMSKSEKKFFKRGQSHRGYYKKWCPKWRETFHPSAIELLKELGYVE